MSTGLIIAIVVAALLLIALFAFVLPRARRNAQVKARERELGQRRERAAETHRDEAAERNRQAEMAEQKARMAEAEAQRERAEAQLGEQRAQMHEQGLADHELIDESERERFAGTSAVPDEQTGTRADEAATTREGGSVSEGERPMHEPAGDYEQGRIDERKRSPDPSDDESRSRPA
jgi:FtsZ-interacting cell division protein ZipA